MRIAGHSIALGQGHYGTTIVDSGTTFMYLPPSIYNSVLREWQTHCPWGACGTRSARGEYPDDYCYTASEEEVTTIHPLLGALRKGSNLRTG